MFLVLIVKVLLIKLYFDEFLNGLMDLPVTGNIVELDLGRYLLR